MAVLYKNRIKREKNNGTINPFTIENVPNYWKQQTLNLLAEEGLDGYGNPLENN